MRHLLIINEALLVMLLVNIQFITEPLVRLLSTTDPIANTDAVVYGLGTVKLMSSNHTLRNSLKAVGVVQMLADYLQKYCQVYIHTISIKNEYQCYLLNFRQKACLRVLLYR